MVEILFIDRYVLHVRHSTCNTFPTLEFYNVGTVGCVYRLHVNLRLCYLYQVEINLLMQQSQTIACQATELFTYQADVRVTLQAISANV